MKDRRSFGYDHDDSAAVVSIEHAIIILRERQKDIEREDQQRMPRDARVYANSYSAARTISLLFNVEGNDPTEVIASLEALKDEET